MPRLPRLALAVTWTTCLVLTQGCHQAPDAGASEQAQQKKADTKKTGDQHPHGERPGGRSEEQEGVLVRVEPVRVEPMASLYSTSATLRASQQATVTARTRGVVRRLAVEEGDRVAAGQALAYLEDEEQTIVVERTGATLETRRWEFERSTRLFEQELVSEEVYERARREARDAEQAVALAELGLSRTVIRAPFAGVVITRHLDVGNTLADGQPVYTLAAVSRLLADVNVPERHVARLAAGQAVHLKADASGEQVEARIERIAPSVDVETGTVKVTLTVPGSGALRPGSFVRVDIVTDTHPEALVVPRSALVAEGRRWNLYRVAAAGGTAEQVEVELGFESGARVEIVPLADGPILAAGDRVVVAGVGALSDGARVEIQDS